MIPPQRNDIHRKAQTMKRMTLTLLIGLMTASAMAQQSGGPASGNDANVPASKRTVLGLYLTSADAYAKWKADPDSMPIVDVRSPEEYVFVGHPTMALNIPVSLVAWESIDGQPKMKMKPNPHFIAEMRKRFKPEDAILIICRSGARSTVAVNILAEAGFKAAYNVHDGVEGDKVKNPDSVFHGMRKKDSWKNAGLPWTYSVDPAKMIFPVGKQ